MHTLEQLKQGDLKGIKRLSLAENLAELPPEVLNLKDSLEILDVSNNCLSSLPEFITELPHLRIVFASNNHFDVLPEVLGRCLNLEMIGFKSNQIQQVPADALPPKLRWLILTDNRISSLPESLGERLNLQKLALAGNQLTALPQSMAKLVNLELLRISANQLAQCPAQLLDLPKLAWFAFSGNPFSHTELQIESVPTVNSKDLVLQQQLGAGASGVISKASWQHNALGLPESVAVKKFKGEVTSDGYPQDELNACLKVGDHPALVKNLAQIKEPNNLALVMALIPEQFTNLGLPPTLETCTRDTFAPSQRLSFEQRDKIVRQMQEVFNHMHASKVCHGDLYAHNTLVDPQCNIIFGDFGAASMYHMLPLEQQQKIERIEQRALQYFIDDMHSITH